MSPVSVSPSLDKRWSLPQLGHDVRCIGRHSEGVGRTEVGIALALAALALIPAVLLFPAATAVAVSVGAVCAGLVALQARRLIGGWVGDTLGACEQAFEIGFLVAFAGMVVA